MEGLKELLTRYMTESDKKFDRIETKMDRIDTALDDLKTFRTNIRASSAVTAMVISGGGTLITIILSLYAVRHGG